MDDIAKLSQDLINSLRAGRQAITGRGGEISPTAGFENFAAAIYNIPADNAITTITQEQVAEYQKVPDNSMKYAYLAEFGGMTYRDAETNTLRNAKPTKIVSEGANLIPYPFDFKSYTLNGVTFTANEDQTITISGTSTAGSSVGVIRTQTVKAKAGETFTVSTSGVWTGKNGYVIVNQRINGEAITYVTASTASKTFTVEQDCDLTVTVVVVEGNTYNGSITIMLNRGSTAVPWKPYVGTISTREIPEEIQALDGFGEGISLDYYNKVDLVNNKFRRAVYTVVLDGNTWGVNYVRLYNNGLYYAAFMMPLYGINGADCFTCSHFDNASGVKLGHSYIAGDGNNLVFVNNDQTLTTAEAWNAWLAEQYVNGTPVTATYALAEPIESDLPVYMSPLNEVEGGGSWQFVNERDYAVPSKIIYQTRTQ